MPIDKNTMKKALLFFAFIAAGFLSLTIGVEKFSDIRFYDGIIKTLDAKKNTVFALSSATTTASLLISLIPGDVGTPIANQFADISGYLLIILSIIYFEKYLLTIIGLVVFKYILPFVFFVLAFYVHWQNENRQNPFIVYMAVKIGLLAIILLGTIPASVAFSNKIDETYKTSINNTIEEIESNEGGSILSFTTEVGNKFKAWVNNFIEYTAVLIVTSCLIPLATLFLFAWLVNTVFGANLIQPRIGNAKNLISEKINNGASEMKKMAASINSKIKGDE